eukprot:CAMPEP_0177661216 /NCGR_PEP_ID=MMETSP0447-20121125/18534_1 /TAXON_ID=0 /ORGANISM="Stygamoeba regulata, Strain BSH-02190019" /LENGTH=150 /DNA_ID=CAMNT_0019166491 /DNA_START=154 /DNA_END=604 /DNA_ORIENTATION=+
MTLLTCCRAGLRAARPALPLHVAARAYGKAAPTRVECNNLEEFREKVVKAPVPTVVQFHARWSRPCQELLPHAERTVRRTGGKVAFATVDFDRNFETCSAFFVNSVPYMLTFHDGVIVDKAAGPMSDAFLEEYVEAAARRSGKTAGSDNE